MKSSIFIGFIVMSLLLGCNGNNPAANTVSEPQLTSFDGVKVINFKPYRNDLLPADQTYIALKVRNNALGKSAINVTATIYDLGEYGLLDCLGNLYTNTGINNQDYRNLDGTNCSVYYQQVSGASSPFFLYDLDSQLTVDSHGIQSLFPGDEYDFYWGIRAPSSAQIGDLYYKHDIHYSVDFDYSTDGAVNLVGLSSNEYQRRVDAGESTAVSSASDQTAGPIYVSASNTQMIYDSSVGQVNQDMVVTLENKGTGLLSGDLNIINVTIPEGIQVLPSSSTWWTASGNGWIARSVSQSDLAKSLTLHIPYRITDSFFTFLRSNNIPVNTFTFLYTMNYTYAIDGTFEMRSRPLIIYGGITQNELSGGSQ